MKNTSLVVSLATVIVLAGCGGGGLSATDKAACGYAYDGTSDSAIAIMGVASDISDENLRIKAKLIQPQAAPAVVQDAMTIMTRICSDTGWQPSAEEAAARSSGDAKAVQSDLNLVAMAMETAYTESGAYPNSWSGTAPETAPGSAVVVTLKGQDSFILTGCRAGATEGYVYDSAGGGVRPEPVTISGCASATTGATTVPAFGAPMFEIP